MGHVLREKLRQAEIRDFWGEILVQEDIAGLYISMNDVRVDLLVEKGQALGDSDADLDPRAPAELDSAPPPPV